MNFTRGKNPFKTLNIGKFFKNYRYIYIHEELNINSLDLMGVDIQCVNAMWCVPGFPNKIKGFDKNKDLILMNFKGVKNITCK